MLAKPATNLEFETTDDIAYLTEEAMNVFVDEVFQKKLPVLLPIPTDIAKVTKAKDGRVVGGIVGISQWNVLQITHIAAHPDFCPWRRYGAHEVRRGSSAR
jgi:hypothetical protein